MGRKRRHDRDLPERWKRSNGAIYYIVPKGQGHLWDNKSWFPLGRNESEAYKTWADRIDSVQKLETMGQLFDRYLLEHTPTVRPKTQNHHRSAIKHLRRVFGDFLVIEFESSWAFKYYDERKKSGISAANTDIKTLSHVFTKAIEWGVIKNSQHPMRGLRIKQSDNIRDRYVEDWELSEFTSVAPEWLRLYVVLKLLTGMDKSTLLSIKRSDLTEDGIEAARLKTKGKKRIYEWSEELRQCAGHILSIKRPVGSVWLFCTSKGQPYLKESGLTSGFDSTWKRTMAKALESTKLEERFTEHDLRAKAASDSHSLEFAQKLLGHADSRITDKVYRRKPERVKPATLNKK